MALAPFGKGGKSAKYHGASGPSSKGRMPKSMSGPRQKADTSKLHTITSVAGMVDDNITNSRVQVSDSEPNATSAPGGLGR